MVLSNDYNNKNLKEPIIIEKISQTGKILLTRVKLVTVYEPFAIKAGGDLAAYFRPANATIQPYESWNNDKHTIPHKLIKRKTEKQKLTKLVMKLSRHKTSIKNLSGSITELYKYVLVWFKN